MGPTRGLFFSMSYLELTSKRLRFFPWDESLTEAWEPFFEDPKATAFLGIDSSLSAPDAAKAWVDKQLLRYEKRQFGHLALFDWQEEKLIGSAGILIRKIEGKVFHEIAYSILPKYWGNGYAGEAARTLIDFAQTKLEDPHLISIIHIENTASIQVAKKIGFEKLWERDYEGFPVHVYGEARLLQIHSGL